METRGNGVKHIPVSLPTTVLLSLLGVGVDETVLRKVLWNVLHLLPVPGVIAIVELVRTSHYRATASAMTQCWPRRTGQVGGQRERGKEEGR
jgi:hypothetical protein